MINNYACAIRIRQTKVLLAKLQLVLTHLYSDGLAAICARSLP